MNWQDMQQMDWTTFPVDWQEFVDNLATGLASFLDWYGQQELSIQIIAGLGVIAGFILLGLVLYGIGWLVYQIGKFAVVAAIILVYFLFTVVKLLVISFWDVDRARHEWHKAGDNIEYFFHRCYPPRHGIVVKRQRAAYIPPKLDSPARGGRQRAKNSLPGNQVESPYRIYKVPVCKACGIRFSRAMLGQLDRHNYCYCSNCGVKHVGNLNNPLLVPA